MEHVFVNISPTGDVKVEAKGVTGAGCAALTKAIEESIGKTTGDVKKPEFYQVEQARARAGAASGGHRP